MTCKHHPSHKKDPGNYGPCQSHLSPWKGYVVHLPESYFQPYAGGGGDWEQPAWIYQWQILPNLIALHNDKLAGGTMGERVWYTFDTVSDSILNRQIGESWTTEADDKAKENCLEYQAQKVISHTKSSWQLITSGIPQGWYWGQYNSIPSLTNLINTNYGTESTLNVCRWYQTGWRGWGRRSFSEGPTRAGEVAWQRACEGRPRRTESPAPGTE